MNVHEGAIPLVKISSHETEPQRKGDLSQKLKTCEGVKEGRNTYLSTK